MASLETRLRDALVAVGTQCKQIRTLLNGNVADNSNLLTMAKSNLVAAINEVRGIALDAKENGGVKINDTSSASPTETYSINKIKSEIASTATATRDAILGGAGAAFDTLKEIQDALLSDDADISAIMTALGNRVRVDTPTQGLSTVQKQNARTNIDAYGSVELGNPDTDLATVFNNSLA